MYKYIFFIHIHILRFLEIRMTCIVIKIYINSFSKCYYYSNKFILFIEIEMFSKNITIIINN